LHAVSDEGLAFGSGTKRFPNPVEFDLHNPFHVDFRKRVIGIQIPNPNVLVVENDVSAQVERIIVIGCVGSQRRLLKRRTNGIVILILLWQLLGR
jgi:hypothetical protein